ncbi:unnamed protein product, partial [Iphiclides podalirius]
MRDGVISFDNTRVGRSGLSVEIWYTWPQRDTRHITARLRPAGAHRARPSRMQHASTLVVLTLLQLCRAEIPNALPEWYAANLINDAGFQPKPITEIFTTQATFSSKNPIVVTSTTPGSETEVVFSTSPTTRTQTTVAESLPSTEDTTQKVIPLRENRPPASQPLDIPRQVYQPPPQHIQVLVAQPPQQVLTPQQIQPSPQIPPAPQIPPSPQIQLPPHPVNQQQTTGQPNYFLIYQQAPLSIQQYPQSASQSRPSSPSTPQTTTQLAETQTTTQEATRLTTQPPTVITEKIEETRSTDILTTQTSTTPVPKSAHRNVRQGPFNFSSTVGPFGGAWQSPSTVPGAAYSNPPISSTILPSGPYVPCSNPSTAGRVPKTTPSALPPQKQNGLSGLTIRVSAPRGSITNIKINPSTTTKKPPRPRRKGNNYNNCVDSCRGKKEPLCAAPLAVIPIDPDNLKGFPSICHLACHNSFRKNQPYEKIMDGRCSKLRTRIRTFDKNKLKREELNKAQYTVLNNGPETVVQVIQNERSGLF